MAFGFPAYHTDSFSAADPSVDLRAAVAKTLDMLSWSIREESEHEILAATTMNLRSWGEKVTISFESGNSLTVTSKCALPTQCLDWGKNKANVAKFMDELASHVGAPP